MKSGDDLDKALAGYLTKKSEQGEKDANYHFCMGICRQLRGFTPAMAALAKMKIQQVMLEVEFPPGSSAFPVYNFENINK